MIHKNVFTSQKLHQKPSEDLAETDSTEQAQLDVDEHESEMQTTESHVKSADVTASQGSSTKPKHD